MIRMRPSLWLHPVPSQGLLLLFYINIETLPDLAEKIEEAVPLHNALKELYEELKSKLDCDPPPEVRRKIWNAAKAVLQHWIQKEYASDKIRKLIGKISNGFEFWFTFILHPGVEPTKLKERYGSMLS